MPFASDPIGSVEVPQHAGLVTQERPLARCQALILSDSLGVLHDLNANQRHALRVQKMHLYGLVAAQDKSADSPLGRSGANTAWACRTGNSHQRATARRGDGGTLSVLR